MPITTTCGHPSRARQLHYDGTVTQGVTLHLPSGDVHVTADFFAAIQRHFAGRQVVGGFDVSSPPSGGFGAWVQDNSRTLNSRRLTSRHASSIAAVLRDAGWVICSLRGNTVYLDFRPSTPTIAPGPVVS